MQYIWHFSEYLIFVNDILPDCQFVDEILRWRWVLYGIYLLIIYCIYLIIFKCIIYDIYLLIIYGIYLIIFNLTTNNGNSIKVSLDRTPNIISNGTIVFMVLKLQGGEHSEKYINTEELDYEY